MAEVLTLQAFLREAASQPFVLGEWDCSMTVANWVRTVTGIDPAADLRGRYRTKFGWMRIVKRAGSLVDLMNSMAARAGMKRTDRPGPGDIGVVDIPGVGHAGAIKTASGWAMKLDAGITGGSPAVIAAWGF